MTASTFDLADYLETEKAAVEESLERALERLLPSLKPDLREPTRHGVMTGGKRLRPILCVAAWRAVTAADGVRIPDTPDGVYDLGASLEMIHAYSLMHDDLPCMDDAELRRGKPTPHTLYGEADTAVAGLALIPGAALQAWEASLALGCDEATARDIVTDLCGAAGAGGMVGGQALDLLGEGRALDVEELNGLHRRKTGALLTASLTLGGRAAGGSSERLEALAEYGRSVGLAFQIADDILDATSSAEVLGKNPSDADLAKSTYVALYGAAEAKRRALELTDRARGALRGAGLNSEALDALAEYVVARSR